MKRNVAQKKVTGVCCAFPGCTEAGEYRAPKSPLHVEQEQSAERYLYFCLAHVREYNQKWDYFAQMSMEEIEHFQREAIVGHRKTKPIDGRGARPSAQNAFFNKQDAWFFGFKQTEEPKAKIPPAPAPNKAERDALALFHLTSPFTAGALKSRYRELVKKTHPDRTGGDKQAEEKFRAVVSAYRLLAALASASASAPPNDPPVNA